MSKSINVVSLVNKSEAMVASIFKAPSIMVQVNKFEAPTANINKSVNLTGEI